MKTTKTAPPHESHFTKTTRWQTPHGRWLDAEKGTEFTVDNSRRKRFRFLAHVIDPATGAEWVDAYGPIGTKTAPLIRSISVDRITAAHNKKKDRHDGNDETETA